MAHPKIFQMPVARVYPMYVQKVERKGHTQAEVDTVIRWLTGYSDQQLQAVLAENTDFETFFAEAPAFNPQAKLITGVICGHRVEELADPLMQKLRYLDKLVDEVAKGKPMDRILRHK